MTAEVEVDADECHVTEAVTPDFAIPGELQPCGFTCPDRRWLIAEVSMNGWSFLRVEDPRYLAPLPVVDGKLRVYAPSGLAMVEQTIPLRVSGGPGCTPGSEGIATLTLVPQSDGCGYEVASLQLATEEIDCRKP